MCYSGLCKFEDHMGNCLRPRSSTELCEIPDEEDYYTEKAKDE